MHKKIFSVFVFLLIASISFVLAVQGESQGTGNDQIIGGDKDEYGCFVSAGYSWNGSEQKCVREWETSGSRYQNEQQAQTRLEVQDGMHIGEGGQMIKVQTRENNKIMLEVGGVSADCDCEMKQERIQNKTKLYAGLSNGKNAEIKVMPDTASERALERLRLKVCSEENECQIELKEVGSGEKIKLAYELKTQRQSKVLGLFRARMQVQAQVDAETGEVIKVKKPWWAFLASEPAEE